MNNINIKEIIHIAKIKNRNINKNKILKAYEYACSMHKNQKRKSGENYIIHPLNVAYILADLGLDTTTICAALLHDVVEDTKATYNDIRKIFGRDVAELVEGVTKLGKIFKTIEETKSENYKKMFIAMEKDIRVIILKLADRLHNIRTLKYLKRDRQIAISKETLELYAPIAHKLGINELKEDLQEGSFKYINPKEYRNIKIILKKRIEESKTKIENAKKIIIKELKKQRIISNVKIATKKIYNIYTKTSEKNIKVEEIKDVFIIKIITKSKRDCYRVLGILNTIYSMIPGTFKDYIATPRKNMHQAIHEILVGEDGVIFEVQICDYVMEKISRYGITYYLPYIMYENAKNKENKFEKNLSGIKDSLELEKTIENPKRFLKALKDELLGDEVYVFTQRGNIKTLPKDSTAIDFAYSVDEKVGNHMKKCVINGVMMPFTTKLKNGDIIEIITNEKKTKFKKEWLEEVKTAKAKTMIIKTLNKEKRTVKKEKKFKIFAKYEEKLTLDITKVFTDNKINIENLEAIINKTYANIKILIKVNKNDDLDKIIKELKNIENIERVNIE